MSITLKRIWRNSEQTFLSKNLHSRNLINGLWGTNYQKEKLIKIQNLRNQQTEIENSIRVKTKTRFKQRNQCFGKKNFRT